MNLLLHICCGPCAVFPVKELRNQGIAVTGYFDNHNIHPYQEYQRRLDAVRDFAVQTGLEVHYREKYRLDEFLAAVAADPGNRCRYCYASRLEATAAFAARQGYAAFTSTLLYSRYQQHEEIRRLGDELAQRYGIAFFYADFRSGWQEGIRLSKEMGLYRQQYCGCIYSERDRYLPPARRP